MTKNKKSQTKKKSGLGLKTLLDRAETAFEKKSGWKSRDLRQTLEKLSKLKSVDQLLLGGLLVGEKLKGVKLPSSQKLIARLPRRNSTSAAS